MGRLRTIARRTFLIGSVAIAGGVGFGYYAYRRPHANPLLDDLAEGEAAITPYVLINADGVTLITPRADVGQGVYSAQAALIAEELDIELDQINVDPGPPSAAYYNAALGEELFGFSPLDTSRSAAFGRTMGRVAVKFLGMQGTGGSSSMPDGYEKLRMAGAVARETLKEAAARLHDVARADLKTEAGAVILPDGTKIAYTELAAEAAKTEPVADVELRDEASWRLVGKPMQRVDIVAKSTGTLDFGIDLKMDGMVYAAVRTNPGFGFGAKSADLDTAQGMPGVQKAVQISGGVGVIANSTWRAFQAVNAIPVEWETPDYPADSQTMFDVIGNSFTDELRDSQFADTGDVDAVIGDAPSFEAEYKVPHLAHGALEPCTAVILLTDDRVDLWTGTQIPGFVVQYLESATGLPPEQIHVHAQYSGGSFGRRLEDDYIRHLTEIALETKGVPIKLTYTREEDMIQDFRRPSALARGRGKITDGQITAYDLSIAAPSVIANQMGRLGLSVPGPDAQIVAGAWDQPFAIPNRRVTGYRAPQMVPISSWRSVGASHNGFFHDCFLDELIVEAGMDVLEERIRLADHDLARKTLETVGEMANWGSELGPNRGRGVAYCMSFGVHCAQVIEVTATDAGIKIDKVFCAAEVGKIIDPVNFENQAKGAIIYGLHHAMNCEITYADHMPQQTNFHDYEGMRMYQCPEIVLKGLENGDQVRGIGEPPTPPAAPALANAIFATTGQRIRELPLSKHVDFV